MPLKTYTVRYRDDQSEHHEISADAQDSYDAKKLAMEKIDYLNEHPNAIDFISLAE